MSGEVAAAAAAAVGQQRDRALVTRPREARHVVGPHGRRRAARLERRGHPLVRTEPPRGRRPVVDRPAHERMPERKAPPVAGRPHEVAATSASRSPIAARSAPHGRAGPRRGPPRRCELWVERVSRDCGALQQRAFGGCECGEFEFDGRAQRRWQLAAALGAGQLAQEQGVAVGLARDSVRVVARRRAVRARRRDRAGRARVAPTAERCEPRRARASRSRPGAARRPAAAARVAGGAADARTNSKEASSAQCRSSSTSVTGRPKASSWRRSARWCRKRSAAVTSSATSSSASKAPARTPKGTSRSCSAPRPHSTVMPRTSQERVEQRGLADPGLAEHPEHPHGAAANGLERARRRRRSRVHVRADPPWR